MRHGLHLTYSRMLLRIGAALLLALLLTVAPTQGGTLAQEGNAHAIFSPLNDSGIEGSATLTADGDQIFVSIRAEGALGDHPTHIHQGTCDDLDPNPEFPLTNVNLAPTSLTGVSDSTVDVPLNEVLDEPHLILIHRSEADLDTYLACGDIVTGMLSPEQQAERALIDPLPQTGAGITDPPQAWLAMVALVAGISLVLSLLIAPRRSRALLRIRVKR